MKSAILLVLAAGWCAADVRITGGAVDDQVFQRDAANRADLPLSGVSDANGKAVEARVLRKLDVVPGFDWTEIGRVANGKWSGTLKALGTGGPYRIEVRAGDAVTALNHVLVGDLWVLAGQSNMQGVGDLIDVEQPHELVHNFDLQDHWVVAEEPLHELGSAVDRVHWGLDANKVPQRLTGERLQEIRTKQTKGAGLGLPFAVEMVKRTGVPVGLLSCAHGGTSMDQWDPAKKDLGGDSLYGSMLRRFRAAGGKVTGVLWYQGESDAGPRSAPLFPEKFERFVAAVRSDFGDPNLPFYWVQIGRFINDSNPNDWNFVQEAQRLTEGKIAAGGVVAAVDLALDDLIHVGTQDLKRVGRRLANLATNRTKKGPRPVEASFQAGVVRVAFSEVNGRLVAPGRISGFSIHKADGTATPAIYKALVDPKDPSAILLSINGKLPEGATLRYGAGKDPYCNVRDTADMALPVFGPLPIRQ